MVNGMKKDPNCVWICIETTQDMFPFTGDSMSMLAVLIDFDAR